MGALAGAAIAGVSVGLAVRGVGGEGGEVHGRSVVGAVRRGERGGAVAGDLGVDDGGGVDAVGDVFAAPSAARGARGALRAVGHERVGILVGHGAGEGVLQQPEGVGEVRAPRLRLVVVHVRLAYGQRARRLMQILLRCRGVARRLKLRLRSWWRDVDAVSQMLKLLVHA